MKNIGMGLIGPGCREEGASVQSGLRLWGLQSLIADPDVQVIHNTTPNHLHLPIIMAALDAGKHVISDKPLASNADEGRRLRDGAVAAKVAHVVTFNYRGNPLVHQTLRMFGYDGVSRTSMKRTVSRRKKGLPVQHIF